MKINIDPEKIKEILERGVAEVIVKKHLEDRMASGEKLRVKFGIDPTGPAIHLGNAIPLWKLKKIQDLGHQIILLIGDFTARIGDTSDKQNIRQPLTDEEIEQNMKTYKDQTGKILDLNKTEFVYNSQWLKSLSFEDFLKLQSCFTVAQMIERENFHDRYKAGKPISLPEFSYPLMQGYDSVAIKSDVEIGGTDQTFNMLAGRTIQRAYGQEPQDVITLALLEGTDGRKMSKSYGNVISIMDEPNDMYGKIMSMQDEFMVKYFILCTDVPIAEIRGMEEQLKKGDVNPRDIKARLAGEITAMYHGKKEAQKAEKEFNRVFKEKELPSEIDGVELAEGEYNILDLLVKIKMASSKAEAKRLIVQGGIKINGQVEKDWQKNIKIERGKEILIQSGKRKFIKIRT